MKPRFKPQKGWRFRIIVADENGKYVVDDYNIHQATGEIAHRMIQELLDMKGKGRWKRIQSKEKGSQ